MENMNGEYWVLVDNENKPPVIYGGVLPCFHSRKLAMDAKKLRSYKGYKVKKVKLQYI